MPFGFCNALGTFRRTMVVSTLSRVKSQCPRSLRQYSCIQQNAVVPHQTCTQSCFANAQRRRQTWSLEMWNPYVFPHWQWCTVHMQIFCNVMHPTCCQVSHRYGVTSTNRLQSRNKQQDNHHSALTLRCGTSKKLKSPSTTASIDLQHQNTLQYQSNSQQLCPWQTLIHTAKRRE